MSETSLYIKTLEKLCFGITRMDEDSKIFVLLLGFLATTLSPFLAVWYLFHCVTYLISKIIIPLIGITVMLFVGLPLICVLRWIYGIYRFFYSVLINFFGAAVGLFCHPERVHVTTVHQ